MTNFKNFLCFSNFIRNMRSIADTNDDNPTNECNESKSFLRPIVFGNFFRAEVNFCTSKATAVIWVSATLIF